MRFYKHIWHNFLNTDVMIIRHRLRVVQTAASRCLNGFCDIHVVRYDSSRTLALREQVDGIRFREERGITVQNSGPAIAEFSVLQDGTGDPLPRSLFFPGYPETVRISQDKTWIEKNTAVLPRMTLGNVRNSGGKPETVINYRDELLILGMKDMILDLSWNVRINSGVIEFCFRRGLSEVLPVMKLVPAEDRNRVFQPLFAEEDIRSQRGPLGAKPSSRFSPSN